MSLLLLLSNTQPVAGGYDDKPRKKRYVVKVDDQLIVFTSKQAALQALDLDKTDQTVEVQKPLITVPLENVKALASEREALALFKKRLDLMQYEALLKKYEQWQDEDDIEMLMMAL